MHPSSSFSDGRISALPTSDASLRAVPPKPTAFKATSRDTASPEMQHLLQPTAAFSRLRVFYTTPQTRARNSETVFKSCTYCHCCASPFGSRFFPLAFLFPTRQTGKKRTSFFFPPAARAKPGHGARGWARSTSPLAATMSSAAATKDGGRPDALVLQFLT